MTIHRPTRRGLRCSAHTALGSLLVALAGAGITAAGAAEETTPRSIHWLRHDRNTTGDPIFYLAEEPNEYQASGFILHAHRAAMPGIGGLYRNDGSTPGLLPTQIRHHWTSGVASHWRFDELFPYQLIPADVIQRASVFGAPPLLIRFTFLPGGRLRFSWHECSEVTCRERASPTMRFNAHVEFQGIRVDEPVPPKIDFPGPPPMYDFPTVPLPRRFD